MTQEYLDVEVEQGHILRVCEGPSTGLAWIVAPLLDHTKMRKFSGTNRAGSNKDLPGQTCDALAHFSLYDSHNSMAFVDVQGAYISTLIKTIYLIVIIRDHFGWRESAEDYSI